MSHQALDSKSVFVTLIMELCPCLILESHLGNDLLKEKSMFLLALSHILLGILQLIFVSFS